MATHLTHVRARHRRQKAKLAPGTLVEVQWDDAYMLNDDEHTDGTEHYPPAIEQTVGYVVRDERASVRPRGYLVVAMSMHTDALAAEIAERGAHGRDARYRDRMRIPAGMIVGLTVLREGAASADE